MELVQGARMSFRTRIKNAGKFKEKLKNVITRKVIHTGRRNLIFLTLETLE